MHVGMFDTYQPLPVIPCVWCGHEVSTWQGKDGPNLLVVWRQGEPHPIDHPVDEECRLDPASLAELALPPEFVIFGWCDRGHRLSARCRAIDGVWQMTDLSEALDEVGSSRQTDLLRQLGYRIPGAS
jgi:hypothetical protein